jgi:hypothetical protein
VVEVASPRTPLYDRNRKNDVYQGFGIPAYWVSRDLPAQKRARITKAQDSPPDLVVVQPVRDWTCAECQGTGDLLIMDNAGPLCLACADMDHLVFLPSGEAALTRRAKKASALSAVVVRWSRTRKRVGRSAAGRSLDEEALTLAVVASVRHEDTDYDSLLMSGVGRAEARDQIRLAVDRILASWS